MVRVACFDVFDTVLTRAIGSPHSVFLLVGESLRQEGLIECTPEVFARLRIAAESTARHSAAAGEVSLDDIYRNLSQSLGLDSGRTRVAAERECQWEKRLARPVTRTLELIGKERAAGSQIVFASDMYHSKDFVGSLLQEAGAMKDGDGVFVSAEHGKSKTTGMLFGEIARAYSVKPSAIYHYGNDREADILGAAKAKASALRCADCDLTRYESLLNNASYATGGLSSHLSGASRLTRMDLAKAEASDPAIDEVAAGVIGPFLTAYLIWVLTEAERHRLTTLYFVSRDGQIMLDVAKRLAPKIGVDCELRYLFGSRQAWHLPSLTSISENDFSWIFESRDRLSVSMVLRRLHIDPDEMADWLTSQGIPATRLDSQLIDSDRSALKKSLLERSALRSLVQERAEHQRKLLHGYLAQEGVFRKVRWGLVDIGWRGRLQRSLERSIQSGGGTPAKGFYVGLNQDSGTGVQNDMQAYLFHNPRAGGWGREPPGVAYVTEMFCQATHGMVTGYKEEGGKVLPTFHDRSTAERLQWGVPRVHAAVAIFAEHCDSTILTSLRRHDLRPAVVELLEEFWTRPSLRESQRWGKFPYEDDQAGTFQTSLAKPRTPAGAIRVAFTGADRQNALSWPAASWHQTPLTSKALYLLAYGLRRGLGRLRSFAMPFFFTSKAK
jgi:FMN phosphatase YigB (HAD superfamily)